MQAIKDLIKAVTLPPTTKNTEYCVRITHITDPHNFYVRSIQFSKLIQHIEKTTPSKQATLADALFSNKTILFNLNAEVENPKYARGKIVLSGTNGCRVFALDYGCYKENVPYELMWDCDECLIDMQPLAINCRLANCAPIGNSWGRAIDAFITYVGDERAHMKIVDTTSSQVVVTLDNTCATDIATVLALSGHTTLAYVHNDLNQITSNATPPAKVSYEFKQLKLNDALHVRVVSGRSLDGFYVAEINDYHKYLKEQEDIDYYSTDAKAIEKDSMKYGDSVLIWGGGHSYDRGFIKEVNGDSDYVLAQMVDTGTVKEVHYGALKVTPEQCVKLPAVAIYCCLKGKVPYDLNLLFHPGRQFVITVQELGKQLYLEKPNVVTISHFDPRMINISPLSSV